MWPRRAWIAWQLEAEGYQVVVQAWDFTPGRDWAHEMQQAITTAERVVAVLSAAYLRSGHGEAEWRAFYAQDPSGERGLLLPIRVSDVEPPGLLSTRIYVDLVGLDAQSARAALQAAALGSRGKPTQAPAFPGDQRVAVNATGAPWFPGELPPIWNVPFHPNPFFKGRDLLLIELQTRLTTPGGAVRRVVLTGLGGVGKTSVAVEHVYRQHADYDLVWCINGEQPASLLADLATLANQLGLTTDIPQELQVAVLRGWLERHQRWLLVLDNVDDPAWVAELLPRSATGQVVITSRTGIGWELLANVLVVDTLAPEDAAGLLLARTGETGPAAETAAATLAATLGGLPLALEQAGAYVASTGTINLAGYAELFATRALELLTRGQPLGYQHTVATTWSLALQTLREAQPGAVELLTLLAFVGPDNLPQPLLATHHDELPEPLASIVGDPLATADVVAALRSYSLIRVVADGLFVHRLLQTVVCSALDTDIQRAWASAALRLLRAGFPADSSPVPTWPESERLLPHALVVADFADRLDLEPEARLWLLSRSGTYLWSRGQYPQAVRLHEQALTGYQQLLGSDHPTTLWSMDNLGEALRDLGELNRARQLHEQALAGYRRTRGDDHIYTLHAMTNLAVTLTQLGDLPGARDLHEQALAGCRQLFGDDHPETLYSMTNLALTYRDLGDLQDARDLLEQALAGRQRVLGHDHASTLRSMNFLAGIRQQLGDLQDARGLLEQVLVACRQVLGDDHPDTVHSMNNLAEARRALGDLHGARSLHEQALAAYRRVLGDDDHPSTLKSIDNLAETVRTLGDLQGAHELLEQALAVRQRALGADHPDTLDFNAEPGPSPEGTPTPP